jgi:Family of unknown function (DUF6188)
VSLPPTPGPGPGAHSLRHTGWVSTRRSDGGFDIEELAGLSLTCISLTGLVELLFGQERDIKLQIERDFLIWHDPTSVPAKVEFRPYLDPWEPSGMRELALLFRSVVASAEATPDALLTIEFTNGHRLEVAPDPMFEGWNLWSPGKHLGQPAGGDFR